MANTETGWMKEFPQVSGWYWMRGFRQYRTLPTEVNGDKFGMMYGNGVLFDAVDAEGAEFLGPLSPSDAEQLVELRRVAGETLQWLEEKRDMRAIVPIEAIIRNLRMVLNPKQPGKETQG